MKSSTPEASFTYYIGESDIETEAEMFARIRRQIKAGSENAVQELARLSADQKNRYNLLVMSPSPRREGTFDFPDVGENAMESTPTVLHQHPRRPSKNLLESTMKKRSKQSVDHESGEGSSEDSKPKKKKQSGCCTIS